ncbi:MAG: hypothetical protein IJ660_00995 [Alphaproteobacteria bacterium]|nr:hypothetical protein [Alphaproteobacteria bacterium]
MVEQTSETIDDLQNIIADLNATINDQRHSLIYEKLNKLKLTDELGKVRKIMDTALVALAEIDLLTKSAKQGVHYAPLACIQQVQQIVGYSLEMIEEKKK